nr:restriction endonuclease subunit S [Xylophilus sp.]
GVAEITTGSTPGRGSDGYYGGNIPWVKTTEVAGDEIYDTEEKLTEAGLKAIRGKLHPINSIVVAMYGQGQTRGRCALLRIEASCNQACGVIKPSEEFVPWFMFTQLLLAYERLRALGRGGNQENLNLQLLGSFEVLVPPLPLQQTFATRIASIEALKATHRRALAALDALFASLQQRAFAGQL